MASWKTTLSFRPRMMYGMIERTGDSSVTRSPSGRRNSGMSARRLLRGAGGDVVGRSLGPEDLVPPGAADPEAAARLLEVVDQVLAAQPLAQAPGRLAGVHVPVNGVVDDVAQHEAGEGRPHLL